MKRSELAFTLILIPIDFLALMAAGAAAYSARFFPIFTAIRPVIFDLNLENYVTVLVPLALVFMGVFALSGLYSIRRKSIARELTRITLAVSASMALVFAISFFSRVLFESRFIALAAWVLAIIFAGGARMVVRGLQRSLLNFGIGVHRIVLIGEGSTAQALIETFAQKKSLGFHVVGSYREFHKSLAERLRRMKREGRLDEVILADPDASRKTTMELVNFTDTEHLGFRYSADLFAAAIGRSVIHTYAGVPVIEVQKTPLDGWGAIYKRLFDIVLSLVFMTLTLPIQVIVGTALFLEQPGRVLFSRTPDGKKALRVGQGGKPFHYFKFRSMIKDAHKLRFDPAFIEKHENARRGSPLFKLKDDPRVTPVGKWIRKFSLDELPEFYLVLLGRMSLVGPRPHLPEEVDLYEPQQRKVLTVKPGITGLAQISGRAELAFADEVRLDTYYIEHWSPWLDLHILLRTPWVVLFKRPAY